MATENLKVKITADASQAKAEIGKFKESLKGTVGAAESATGSVTKLKNALVALAAVKVAKAMIQNAISVAAAGDAIKDNAQKVFMSTTAYQEWGYVLQQNGVEMASLKTGMRQFAQQVANGSDTLAKYGITARDIDTAFEQAIYTIQNMTSETERVAAATELFGSRALELMPVLNLTNAETQALMQTYRAVGGTMSNELIASSDTLTDSLTEMKAAWGGLKNLLAAYVIPVLSKVVQWITITIAYVRILLRAFLGVKESFGGSKSGGGGNKKTSIAGTSGSVAKNTGKAAGNLKKASKHAKDLRKTLMGIDELTKLAEKATAGAAGGSGGVGGIGGGLGDIGGGIGDIGDWESVADVFSPETLERIEAFRQKVEKIAEPLNGIYLILKGLVEISLGKPVQGFTDLKEGISKLLPDLETLKKKWEDLKQLAKDKISAVFEVILPKWAEIKEQWLAFKDKIKGKWIEVKAKLPTWSDVKADWLAFKDKLKGKWIEFKAKLPKWSEVKNAWNSFKAHFKGKWVDIKAKLPKWSEVKNAWNSFKAHFKGKWVDIKANIPSWSSIKDKWQALKDKFTGKSVDIKIKIPGWNSLKTAWNNLMANFKGKKVNISVGLGRRALSVPTASVLNEPVGTGTRAVDTSSSMYETVQRANSEMVSALATMTRQVIAAIETKDLSVNIGDEQVARSAQRGNTAYYNRTGKALITI